MKRVHILVVLAVAIVLAAAGAVTYIVTRPPTLIDLKLTDRSTVGAIEGNLTSYDPIQNTLVLNFAAATYANETDGKTSTLTLRLHAWTYFDGTADSVRVNINATVIGVFASDLHPATLQLFANQTGAGGGLQSWSGLQFGTNVSFDPSQSFGFYNGTGVLSATITAARFGYSDYFAVMGRPWYNRFVGFRAVVTGPFTPAVSVGILLKIINTNGGTWA